MTLPLKSRFPYWDGLQMSVFESELRHQFYFDNYDVTAMISGIADVYISDTPNDWRFKQSQFDDRRMLVQNLVYGGMLNVKTSVGMLPAHQAEFYGRIKNEVVHNGFYFNPKDRIRKAFYDGLNLEITSFGIKSNPTQWAKQLNQWLDRNSTEVGKLYKLLYMTFQLHWTERIYALFNDKKYCSVLDYDDSFDGLTANHSFVKLKAAWDKLRAGKEHNNYRDAMALFYLARHTEAFNQGKTDVIPVFFDSSGSFTRAVKEAGLEKQFEVDVERNGKKLTFPVLRDDYYFQTYALVHSKELRRSGVNDEYDKIVEQYQKAKETFIKITDELSVIHPGDSRTLDNYDRINREVDRYVNYDFLRYVVLPHFSEEQFAGVLRILSLDRYELQKYQERIASRFHKDVEKIRQNMRKDFLSFEESRIVFQELKNRCFELNRLKRGIPEDKRPLDIFLDFSLFRFFIPVESKNALIELFGSQELLADETPPQNMALLKLLDLFMRATLTRRESTARRALSEVETYQLVASFWVFSLYKYFKRFTFNKTMLPHSLLMLIGASLLRDEGNFDEVKAIIKILDERSKLAESERLKAEIDVSIAYLYFQLWTREDGRLFIENNEVDKTNTSDNHLLAITHARQAYNFFSQNKVHYYDYELYATNLYIYYVTDCGYDEAFVQLRPVVNHLLKLRGSQSQHWHFRYDDTLARYYHRDSTRAKNLETKKNLAANAQSLMKRLRLELEGREAIRDVRDIYDYSLILDGYVADLEA